MNKDQRLIPFLGGLVLGGVGGAAFDNKYQNYNYGYNYYPPYNNVYNQYPIYYQTQPISYNQQYYPYNMYANQTYPQAVNPSKLIEEQPSTILYSSYERGNTDLSYVPIYRQK